MPHATLKLRPSVDQTDTPTLNEAGISQSQLIRFVPDPVLGAICQKRGGFTAYYPSPMAAIVRALWPWEDTQSVAHLAVGTEPISASSQLAVITNGVLKDITPQQTSDDVTADLSTNSGDSIVTITDATTTNITQYDSVYIPAHISCGGLILFGLYACDPDGTSGVNTYTVQAKDRVGNPLPAPATSTTTQVAEFTTASGSSQVNVELPDHGYMVGNTYPCLISTDVGGMTLYGNYNVLAVVDADNFTINGPNLASSNDVVSINSGNARYIYNIGLGAIPPGTGFGIGGFGLGGFGTGAGITPTTGTPISANDWSLANWGEVLITCPDNDDASPEYQPIYQWESEDGSPTATVIPEAPPVNDGLFIAMPQRQIVAWGSTFTGIGDPLLVRWCDVNNFGVWIGQTVNQAGSFRLTSGSRIVGGLQAPQQAFLWTDIDLWSMQYIGQPYIYSFNVIGTGCGLVGRRAMASINGTVYWMGASQFFRLAADGVEPVPCDVWDVVFQNIDTTHPNRIRTAVNSRFNEIAWYYASASGSGEIDSYVKFNVLANTWDYGAEGRSAWADQSVLGAPIGADPSSLMLYQHETSTDAAGEPLEASFRTGYFAIGDGNEMTFVDQVWPDMKWGYYGGDMNATVSLTFYAANYPGQTPTVFGPYTLTQATTYITPRIRARLLAFEISSDDLGSFWRTGAMRYRWAADGRY